MKNTKYIVSSEVTGDITCFSLKQAKSIASTIINTYVVKCVLITASVCGYTGFIKIEG